LNLLEAAVMRAAAQSRQHKTSSLEVSVAPTAAVASVSAVSLELRSSGDEQPLGSGYDPLLDPNALVFVP